MGCHAGIPVDGLRTNSLPFGWRARAICKYSRFKATLERLLAIFFAFDAVLPLLRFLFLLVCFVFLQKFSECRLARWFGNFPDSQFAYSLEASFKGSKFLVETPFL